MFANILALLFLLGSFVAPNKAEAVFNGEEEKPGLREEVSIKQETQIAQGEIALLMKQHASSSAAAGIQTPSETVTTSSQTVHGTVSSSWIGWVESALLLAAGVFVFCWMIRIS